jgi:hypothetical protein
MADGVAIAQGLLGAASVGDGPTAEQRSVVTHLLHGYFGSDADLEALGPIGPAELHKRVDADDRERVVDLLVLIEFCRHPGDPAQADRVEEYAAALGVDNPFLRVARDALVAGTEEVMADWSRFREPVVAEPDAPPDDAELGARLRGLADCPAGSLGRAFFDFYDRWRLPFPGEAGGGGAELVAHDFGHVLAGYEPVAPGELALQAILTSATGFEHHFSGLVASLALYEAGKFAFPGIDPKVAALDRPGAAAELAEAFRRGSQCVGDFSAIDHLARANDPLDAVRADCGIPALAA